jgi:molybdenum cofactor cytidylyltransferase
MGCLKQLLLLDDKPVIRHCIDNIFAAGIGDVVAVLSGKNEELIKTVKEQPVKITFNENPSSEMVDSVRIGLQAIDPSSSAVLICLSDHPLISVETFQSVFHIHELDPDKIIIPTYNGKKGHPALFPKDIIRAIFSGFTLREIMTRDKERVRLFDVSDEGVILDMDTMKDYREMQCKIREELRGKRKN